jgi:ribosome-associated protein
MAASSKDLSRDIARLVDEKLGEDIVCLDMRELVTYTDYLVICTARNERQADAIAEEVHLRLKHDRSLLPVNPDRSGDVGWTVLDYLDCVLHIFTEEARVRYDLEDLWHEAPRVDLGLDQSEAKSASAA